MMELRAARRSERDEVLDLLELWYHDREFFARYNQNDPKFRDELCLIARDGRALVATVQIFDRAVRLDGQATPMGGIGSVFTREDSPPGGRLGFDAHGGGHPGAGAIRSLPAVRRAADLLQPVRLARNPTQIQRAGERSRAA